MGSFCLKLHEENGQLAYKTMTKTIKDKMRQGKTRQDKNIQDSTKTRQDQDKTGQDKAKTKTKTKTTQHNTTQPRQHKLEKNQL